MRSEWGGELLDAAKSGTDTESARRAYEVVRQEAAAVLAGQGNAFETQADRVLQIEATNALAEAQKRLEKFEAQDKMRQPSGITKHYLDATND
jgi:hypothetical protein